MNTKILDIIKKAQTIVLEIIKKAETLLLQVEKNQESFAFKIYSNLNPPPYNPRRYATFNVTIRTVDLEDPKLFYFKELSSFDGETMSIDWGDGNIEQITGVNTWVSHHYLSTGDYTIRLLNPDRVKVIILEPYYDYTIFFNSKWIIPCINLEHLELDSMDDGIVNTADLRHMPLTFFEITYGGSNFISKINMTHMENWNPTTFSLIELGDNENNQVVFTSSLLSTWSPTNFYLQPNVVNTYGNFDSSDVSSWSPENFSLRYVTGILNSSDLSSWNPVSFNVKDMNIGTTGTFNTSDLSSWNPDNFTLSNMPEGYIINIEANSFRNFISVGSFNMSDNGLSQSAIDAILEEFYIGFVNRTATSGNITLGNVSSDDRENSSPSGFYRASISPQYGQEYRYELIMDTFNINPTKKWTSITVEDLYVSFSVTSPGVGQVAELFLVDIEGGFVSVDYGDGIKVTFSTGSNIPISNEYQSANTFTAKIYNCENITKITFRDVQDCTASFSFSEISKFRNLKFLDTTQTQGLYFDLDTSHMSSLNLNYFKHTGKNNGTTVINSVDMLNWEMLTGFNLSLSSPIGSVSGTLNSTDLSGWNPSIFILNNIPSEISGTINTSDFTAWSSITSFQLYNTSSSITGSINSSSFSTFTSLEIFRLDNLSGSFVGDISISDFQNKPLINFGISNMPLGVTGVIDTSPIASLSNPSILGAFYLYNLLGGFTGEVDTGDFSLCSGMGVFEVHDNESVSLTISANSFSSIPNLYAFNIRNNLLSRADVDQVLLDLWNAFPSRTLGFGTAYLDGSNYSPSGIYQAGNPPDTGQEYAYELVNDTQNVSSGIWTTIYLGDYAYEPLSGVDAQTLGTLDPQTLALIEIIE